MLHRQRYASGFSALAVLAAMSLPGCSGSGPPGPAHGSTEGRKIAELVEGLGDVQNPKKRAALFAKGVTPTAADSKRIDSHYLSVVGSPSVTGDTATAKVKARESSSTTDLGPFDWTFVKEGENWKVKSMQLP